MFSSGGGHGHSHGGGDAYLSETLSPRLMFVMMMLITLLVLAYGMSLFMENQSREEKLKEACGKLKKEHDRMKEENIMIKREAEARGGGGAAAEPMASSPSSMPPPPQVQTIVKKETPPEVLAELEAYKVRDF